MRRLQQPPACHFLVGGPRNWSELLPPCWMTAKRLEEVDVAKYEAPVMILA